MVCIYPNCEAEPMGHHALCAPHFDLLSLAEKNIVCGVVGDKRVKVSRIAAVRSWRSESAKKVAETPPGDLPDASTALYKGMLSGEPLAVIGGGPSLRGFDWRRIPKHVWTIGVNMAFQAHPDWSYVCDQALIERLESDDESGWHSASTVKLVHKASLAAAKKMGRVRLTDCYWINTVHRRREWSTTIEPTSFGNSGLVCVNLADALGADPIYLLGFDMFGEYDAEEKRQMAAHWHDYYIGTGQRTSAAAYPRMLKLFRDCVPASVKARIVNCSLESRLEECRKISLEEFCERA